MQNTYHSGVPIHEIYICLVGCKLRSLLLIVIWYETIFLRIGRFQSEQDYFLKNPVFKMIFVLENEHFCIVENKQKLHLNPFQGISCIASPGLIICRGPEDWYCGAGPVWVLGSGLWVLRSGFSVLGSGDVCPEKNVGHSLLICAYSRTW